MPLPLEKESAPPPAAIRSLFTRIAGIYDRLNRILTLGIDVIWRRRALKRLNKTPGTLLDLATGTADFAVAVARRFPEVSILGIDLTPAMLDVGRTKFARAGLEDQIELREGNALALNLEASHFDTVLCAFGFRNFPDPARALHEVARVLEPGGQLLVLELFRPTSRILGGLTSLWLRLVSPLFARKTRGDYIYLRTSIEQTRSVSEFEALARSCGFVCDRSDFFWPSCSCLVFHRGNGQSALKQVE